VLTDDPAGNVLQDGLRNGVRAVLPRSATAAEIAAAIVAAGNGLVTIRAEAWPELGSFRNFGIPADSPPREELSPRELQVLRMLAEGHANKIIAWQLGISEHTVKFHISSILAKLGVSTRTEAVAVGIRLGLIML
jgi:DNA-binding NarL/FixJ family response regulator